jgi:hypothetical protein
MSRHAPCFRFARAGDPVRHTNRETFIMRIKQVLTAALLALVAPFANAAFIEGSVGFGDGLANTMNSPTAVVVGLTTINPITTVVAPCTGDFSGCSGAGTAFSFTLGAGGQIVFTEDQFTFTASIVPTAFPPSSITPLACDPVLAGSVAQLCTDKFNFNGIGVVHDNTNVLQDSLALFSWSLTGNCLDRDGNNTCDALWAGSYAAVITAVGAPGQVPEPGSLALIGLALGAAGVASRKRRRA